jgi:peroxiredoxin
MTLLRGDAMKTLEKAPGFENLKSIDGRNYDMSDFSEPILVIIFSCNHCPYVVAYESRIKAIQAKYRDQGVRIIAINSNDAVRYPTDNYEAMCARAKTENFNFDYLVDEDQSVARGFGASNTPHVFVLDKERALQYSGRIDNSWDDESRADTKDLENALDALLANKTPACTSTLPVGCSIKWK